MFRIDPNRVDLAREYKARPFGVHSGDLQMVLNLMRALPVEGHHVLVMSKPHREWTLAVMGGRPPRPRLQPSQVFTSLEAAEWHVFKLRWQMLTGQPLQLD
ncbi:MAG: hypothetical protein FJX68_05400 [Alphaproteobacteria bacterium]|nr:hypothetical protein [Alphaproteobacteria bacterium]